jgi:integrase
MASQTLPEQFDRHTRFRDNPRDPEGFRFRWTAKGEKNWCGYIPGRGYVPLGVAPKKEARAAWEELRGKVGRGEKLAPRNVKAGPVFEKWFESKEERLTTSTRKLYRLGLDRYVLPRFSHRKLADITADDIASFIRSLEKAGLSTSTIENYLRPLQGGLSFACRRGLLATNPFTLLTRDDRPEKSAARKAYEWEDEEIDRLLESAKLIARKPESRHDYSALLTIAIETGLRKGELLGLQWGDIDLDGAVLHVRRQWTKYGELTAPKTPKALRRVPLAPHVVSELRKLRLASPFSQDSDFVFASRDGTPFGHRNVDRRGFEPARDLAGLPGTLTFHDLRHAFASRAAHRGVPLNVLSEIMGHTTVAVTAKVYVHLYGRAAAEDAFRAAMAR